VSESEPAVTIAFDDAYTYAGGQRWDLLGIADAEQHLFVQAGPGKAIESLYWVQFERFLPPSRGEYRYEGRVADIGGLDFVCDTRAYNDYSALNREPESDGAYAQRLLDEHGYAFPEAAVRLRAVHLPTTDRRSELMIIYAERVDAGDFEDGALLPEDSEPARRAFRRALSGMTVTRE